MKHISDIKENNKRSILKLLYQNKPYSKKRIAKKLSLSASVITKLCNELQDEGWITEQSTLNSGKAGRKEIEIVINASHKYCIGVVLNHLYTTIVLTDLQMNVIEKQRFDTLQESGKHVAQLIHSLSELITAHHLAPSDILGIGISIKGKTDGRISFSGIWETPVDIASVIEEELQLPVYLDNGIRCSALLESFTYEYRTFIFIKYMEPGIGGAVMKHGELLRGDHHLIMDFGHQIIDPSADYCPICKRRGCLESLISIEGIIQTLKQSFSPKNDPTLWDICNGDKNQITAETIVAAAEAGSIELNQLFKKTANDFAIALLNTVALWDIPRIILIGDFFLSRRFVQYVESALLELQLSPQTFSIDYNIHDDEDLSSIALLLKHELV
ncbi:sugar kinase [Enterococcus florum]|uniref:Sugar kinase n=1 Tax=Enterococcus florum TaxID=2480627 RepID=A0A4P5P8K3_9ENTE|nr:ROK family transcriptional regulator [Enterococcus florum]GCF94180.1 sugar kinase [Enterococcus florum]